MNPGVTKIDVHQIGAPPFQQVGQQLILTPINNWRLPFRRISASHDEKD
mgnify:CR=1 FL=1